MPLAERNGDWLEILTTSGLEPLAWLVAKLRIDPYGFLGGC